jgi:cytochrome b6-f complex iron-sulfur subunit
MERKSFIRQIIIRGSAAVFLPVIIIQACEKDDSVDEPNDPGNNNDLIIDLSDPKYAALLSAGGSYELTEKNIIVINKGNDTFVALSTICTHQGCGVEYNQASNTLPCPCHGSVFNIDGSVKNGPASTPLKTYPASLDANKLVIDI